MAEAPAANPGLRLVHIIPVIGFSVPKTSHTSTPAVPASTITGWRATLPIHPAAELFPRMSADELRALGKDILRDGLTSAIALWRADPKAPLCLLDGINRLDAIEMVTGSPVEVGAPSLMGEKGFLALEKVIVLDGKKVDPYAYVISANIHRRHLTAEQKRDLIVKLIKATPEKSDRQIAETVKADHKTVGSVRTELEGRGEIPHVAERKDTKGRKQPSRKLGKPTTKPQPAPAADKPKTGGDVQAVRDAEAKRIRALMGREDVGLDSRSEGEAAELGTLLRAWDRASEPARKKFMERVGLIPTPSARSSFCGPH